MLYTHDVTCNLSRWNSGCNDIYKRRWIKAKTILKNSFFKQILHNFSFPVTMCIYINTEYWPDHSFKSRVNWHIFGFFLNNFLKSFSFSSSLLPCNFILRSVCSAFHGVNPSKKSKKIMEIREKFNSFYS